MYEQTFVAKALRALMSAWNDGEGISENELARRTDVAQPTINRILASKSRDPKSETLEPLARFFGLTVSQLRGEVSSKFPDTGLSVREDGISIAPSGLGAGTVKIPHLSWAVLADPAELDQLRDEAMDYRVFPARGFGPRSFCVTVNDESMLGDGQYSFGPGTELICDPDQEPTPGGFVIAKPPEYRVAVFRQLVDVGGTLRVKALNRQYTDMPAPGEIFGRVVYFGGGLP